ncbi:MAG: Flp family type IVb pilin [Deltaproteobacteria bacterium]|nr:Flp family type IVb pilin [Deltaproteobacteria bacterium]
MDLIMQFTFDEAGAPAVEYALLMAFIAVAIAASVLTFGAAVKGLFDNAVAKFPGG